ncbi:MAG: JAB domain-containing protein [Bacteroidia bacterium]
MNIALSKQQRILVESSGDIARIMQQILLRENRYSRQREHFWAIGLNDKFQLHFVELISFGLKSAGVEPMDVFKLAVQKDSKYLYVCHNNSNPELPVPKPYFSQTDRLIQVGKIVGVSLCDVIVIYPNSEDFLSFADVGHMEKLRKSKAFVPAYKQAQEIKKMMKEEIEFKNSQKIARALKKQKIDVKAIAAATGLTLGQIDKL